MNQENNNFLNNCLKYGAALHVPVF